MSEFPSIWQMTKNFSKEFATWMANGAPVVSEDDYKERLSTCNSCPMLDRRVMRCKECGCKVEHKAKWKTADCPLKNWKKQELDEQERDNTDTGDQAQSSSGEG